MQGRPGWYCSRCGNNLPAVPPNHAITCNVCGELNHHTIPPARGPSDQLASSYPTSQSPTSQSPTSQYPAYSHSTIPYPVYTTGWPGHFYYPRGEYYTWEYTGPPVGPYRKRYGNMNARVAGMAFLLSAVIGLILAAFILLAPVYPWNGDPVTVEGSVVTSQGMGMDYLDNVTVILDPGEESEMSTVTDIGGDFRFYDVEPGRHTVNLEREGYSTTTSDVLIFGEEASDIYLSMYDTEMLESPSEVSLFYGIGLLLVILMIIGIAGGIMALRLRRISVSLAGSVTIMLSLVFLTMVPIHDPHYYSAVLMGGVLCFFLSIFGLLLVMWRPSSFNAEKKDTYIPPDDTKPKRRTKKQSAPNGHRHDRS